jgi:hypothetical protein
MKHRRLTVLLALAAGVGALHWWVPPAGGAGYPVAEAVVRPASALPAGTLPATAPPTDSWHGTREIEDSAPHDAFALRLPPAPPVPPSTPPPPPLAAKPFVGPLQPPAPPAPTSPPSPPLQVIGSWHDDRGVSLFVAGPQGVMQARAGDVLLGTYRVKQITSQQVLLQDITTQRDAVLAVPAGVSALR